jgi:hypothetical protein
MSGYTIPGETRRPYALVGPLRLGQAAWLGAAAFGAWHLARLPLPVGLRFALASAVGCLGLALAFLRWPPGDGGEPATLWAVRALRFLGSTRRTTLRQGGRLLPTVQEVRSGTARVGDGLVRVLEVSAAPFELKDASEREAFLAGYRSFLNVLPGPAQIVSVSEQLKLEDYVARLRAGSTERGGCLGELMAAHARFLEGLIQSRHIMTRRHYLVLRRSCREGAGDRDEVLRRLGADEAVAIGALQRMGLGSRTLGDAELAGLVRTGFRGVSAPLPAPPAAFATLATVGSRER